MKLNVHLNFTGNCEEAFSFYERALGTKRLMTMTYGEAPEGSPVGLDWKDKVMHTSIALAGGLLMGCDAPPGRSTPMGGFQVSVEMQDEAEVKRVYDALKEGGSVQMPLVPTFWCPLFGMCTDKFGVAWMVSAMGTGQA